MSETRQLIRRGDVTTENPPTIMTSDTTVALKKPSTKSFTRYLPAVARVLLGLPLTVFGLNGFLNFLPQPDVVLPEPAAAFVGALVNSGYMMQLIAATHLVVGVMLLVNRFVPLALVLFAPFMVHSIAFHLFLERSGLGMAVVFLAFELYLAWVYRAAYRPLLKAKTAS